MNRKQKNYLYIIFVNMINVFTVNLYNFNVSLPGLEMKISIKVQYLLTCIDFQELIFFFIRAIFRITLLILIICVVINAKYLLLAVKIFFTVTNNNQLYTNDTFKLSDWSKHLWLAIAFISSTEICVIGYNPLRCKKHNQGPYSPNILRLKVAPNLQI